jgi:predicted dinucleotide-binding enzyme
VVDITNPVDTRTWDRLATPPGISSAEETQQLVPEGTPVVKAFNTTFAHPGRRRGRPTGHRRRAPSAAAPLTLIEPVIRRGPNRHLRTTEATDH